jgi:hypothetical protein
MRAFLRQRIAVGLLASGLWPGPFALAGPAKFDPAGRLLFDPTRVVQVHLHMKPADWEQLRHQVRTVGHGYAREPFGPAPASPFTWFPARLDIGDQRGLRVEVRKKGFLGSLHSERPALRVDVGRVVAGQKVAGLRRLVLNNGEDGGAWFRQCLGYEIFRAAGHSAPRCAFARVRINGRDLGVYVLLEAVDKAFLKRNFGSSAGALFEGAGSDFRPGWIETFEAKRDPDSAGSRQLRQVQAALELPDDQVLAALDRLVDLDSFLRFWCLEVLIGHLDGYTGFANNFYLVRDPGSGQFQFLPWGADKVMGYPDRVSPRTGLAVVAHSALPVRLWRLPAMRARYVARMRALVEQVWHPSALEGRLARMEAAVLGSMLPSQKKTWLALRENLLDFIRRRGTLVLEDLALGPPDQGIGLLPPPAWRVHRWEDHQQGPR